MKPMLLFSPFCRWEDRGAARQWQRWDSNPDSLVGCRAPASNHSANSVGRLFSVGEPFHVKHEASFVSQCNRLSSQLVGSRAGCLLQGGRVWHGWGGCLPPRQPRDENRVLLAEAWIALFGRAGTITNDI